jgi:anti-sigma-K factor RskA
MNYQRPELLDELAAQYVLGTLRGPARRRFERFYLQTPAAQVAVHRWEDRLLGLIAEIAPVTPPALVWERLRLRIRRESRNSSGGLLSGSSLRLAIAAGVAMFAVALGWWMTLGPGSAQLIASVVDQQQTQWWSIEAPRDRAELRVDTGENLTLDPARAYELWALLPEDGAKPISLGLMPRSGRGTLPLSDAQRAALARARQVAVSLEPPGGSPTDVPTGPVIFVANVVTAG